MEVVDDQEIIANSCKIVRICLRDEAHAGHIPGMTKSSW